MAAHAPKVRWQCQRCGKTEWRMPSRAKRHRVCRACRATYSEYGQHGHRKAQRNRLARVMFVHGLTEREARIWLAGWAKGRVAGHAAAYRRAKRLIVGSALWERTA